MDLINNLISLIIVNHNTGNVLKTCVKSIFEFERTTDFELIIIDQNSSDDSKQIIENLTSQKDNIKTIYLDSNLSFSYANNKGFEISSGEFILIMNPDIIFTEGIFKKLLENFRHNPKLGAISPLLVGNDGKFQNNYFQRYPTLTQYILFHSLISKPFFSSPRLLNRYLENRDIDPNLKKVKIIQQIPCAFLMTKRSVFEQVGRMDEDYFLFFEDVDLCYQINKKYELAIDASLKITHLGGASIRSKNDWWVYGRFIISMNHFFDKNYTPSRAFLLKIFTVKNSLLVIFFEYIKKIFNRADEYRINKHKYYLKEFMKCYIKD